MVLGKGRSCADGRGLRLLMRCQSPNLAPWVLEGDIKGCFDNISFKWILENIPHGQSRSSEMVEIVEFRGTAYLFPSAEVRSGKV